MNQLKNEKIRSRERVTTVVVQNEKILGFRAIDPTSQKRYFFLPGGGIENGESLEAAAIRETLEETGFKIQILGLPKTIDYPFEWNGDLYQCKTHFFKGIVLEKLEGPLTEPAYHQGVCWIRTSDLNQHLAYSKEILEAVLEVLE